MKKIICSPWTVLTLLALGWGPIFVAECIRQMRPDLDRAYAPQGFAMAWLGVCFFCTFGVAILLLFHAIRLLRRVMGRYLERRND